MKPLVETQKAYIAGIVDGEGHIGLAKHRLIRATAPGPDYHADVNVSNTRKELLDWLFDVTAIGIVAPKRTTNKAASKWKSCWAWKLRVDEMAEFLKQIRPYLVIKDLQAMFLLEYLEMEIHDGRKQEVDWKIINGREFIWQELDKLNRRGPSGT